MIYPEDEGGAIMIAVKAKYNQGHIEFLEPIPADIVTAELNIIVIPLTSLKKHSSYLECVGEDGGTYQLDDWTDEAFNLESGRGVIKEDETTSEDIFDV